MTSKYKEKKYQGGSGDYISNNPYLGFEVTAKKKIRGQCDEK